MLSALYAQERPDAAAVVRETAERYHIPADQVESDLDRLLRQHAGRVKLLAISGASNVTGYLSPIHRLAEKPHAAGASTVSQAHW